MRLDPPTPDTPTPSRRPLRTILGLEEEALLFERFGRGTCSWPRLAVGQENPFVPCSPFPVVAP
eukprot:7401619-Pyramimonas_sp.AAC.1